MPKKKHPKQKVSWPDETGLTGRTKVCDMVFQNVAAKVTDFKVSPGKSEQRYALGRVKGTGTIFYLRRNKKDVYRLCKLYDKAFATEDKDPAKVQELLLSAIAADQKINK